MDSINPLSAALAQSTQIQRRQSADKARQARRAQERKQNVDARDDEMEHQVENSEELREIHDDSSHAEQGRKQQAKRESGEKDDGSEHRLDLTA